MNIPTIPANHRFIGRTYETRRLNEIAHQGDSAIIIVHGRRRVGKTELIEQTFRERRLIKFEGLEAQPDVVQNKISYEDSLNIAAIHFMLKSPRRVGDNFLGS